MDRADQSGNEQLHQEALQHLKEALERLDQADAPAHIGAYVDHAIHQLQDIMDLEAAGADLVQIDRKAALQ